MPRTDLHIKVELQYDSEEDPQKLALEVCRQLLKVYGVRNAEVSSITNQD